jgi:hypothetical protein
MKDHDDSVYRNHHLRVPAVLIAVGVRMPGLVTPLGCDRDVHRHTESGTSLYEPPIVGNYVGLHPMTVSVSIFVWGLSIGGVVGPLLAVPLTATLKVLFGRCVWGRRLREQALPIERVFAAEEIEVPTHR